ncbi:unnamed protein product [Parnassius mnemosyne]|uniref:Gustatory receptor n=1 Tax=Parnassius mnemosyne TaxID=213953 RepID=A0AAV1LM45_9NEOP
MSTLKPLKVIFLIENFLFLFRNISFTNKRLVYLMYFSLLLEISICVSNIIVCGYFNSIFRITEILFLYLCYATSLFLIIVALYHSKSFKKLLTIVNTNSTIFFNDDLYLRHFKKKSCLIIAAFLLYSITKIIFTLVTTKYGEFLKYGVSRYFVYMFVVNVVTSDLRYFFEYLVLYLIIYILSEQVKCVIRLVVNETKVVYKISGEIKSADITPVVTPRERHEKIQQWSVLYTRLAEATRIFNRIFGFQITVMLTTAISYISIYIYSMVFMSVDGYIKTDIFMKIGTKLIYYNIEIFFLSIAAQGLHNDVTDLKRSLAMLLTYSLQDYEVYRATKDLLRLVSNRQLQIQAFGSITVDMSLPPTCIILFTTYTVIALQFNNVL